MSIPLYLAALWRHRILVGTGTVIAFALGFLSFGVPAFSDGHLTIHYREAETWSSASTVFVTQKGFPWGRTYLLSTSPGNGAPPTQLGDPTRFASLAVLYTELANSDQVRAFMRRSGPIAGDLQAVTVVPPVAAPPLPLIRLVATTKSRESAVALARRYTNAFQASLREQQVQAGIPPDQRVLIQVTQRASKATLDSGRSKAMPMMIFFTVMFAVVALALVLDNLGRRVYMAPSAERAPVAATKG